MGDRAETFATRPGRRGLRFGSTAASIHRRFPQAGWCSSPFQLLDLVALESAVAAISTGATKSAYGWSSSAKLTPEATASAGGASSNANGAISAAAAVRWRNAERLAIGGSSATVWDTVRISARVEPATQLAVDIVNDIAWPSNPSSPPRARCQREQSRPDRRPLVPAQGVASPPQDRCQRSQTGSRDIGMEISLQGPCTSLLVTSISSSKRRGVPEASGLSKTSSASAS